jgi:hypothetical protein
MSRRPADVPPNADILIGWCVGDRYELEALIGRGSASLVFRVKDLTNGAPLAAKLLFDETWSDAEVEAARSPSRIDHPGITRTLDAGLTEENIPFLITELHDGRTVARILACERPTRAETFHIFLATADVIAAAHAQAVVHGNIKPSNVFVTSGGHIKVVDFGRRGHGVVRPSRAGSVRVRAMLHALEESGPESSLVVTRSGVTRREDDVRALGALLLDMLTPADIGKGQSNRTHELRLRGLGPVVEVIARALSKVPKERPKTAADFVRELTQALAVIRERRSPEASDASARLAAVGDPVRPVLETAALRALTKTADQKPPAARATLRFVTPAACAKRSPDSTEADIPVRTIPEAAASNEVRAPFAGQIESDSIGGLSVAPPEAHLAPVAFAAKSAGSRSGSRRQLISRVAALGFLFLASCLAAYAGLARPTSSETAARERGSLVSAGAGNGLSESEARLAARPATKTVPSSTVPPILVEAAPEPPASGAVQSTPIGAIAKHDLARRSGSDRKSPRDAVGGSRRRVQPENAPRSPVPADDLKAPTWR